MPNCGCCSKSVFIGRAILLSSRHVPGSRGRRWLHILFPRPRGSFPLGLTPPDDRWVVRYPGQETASCDSWTFPDRARLRCKGWQHRGVGGSGGHP